MRILNMNRLAILLALIMTLCQVSNSDPTQKIYYKKSTIINPQVQKIKCFALSPFGNHILISESDGSLKLFSYQSGELIKQVELVDQYQQTFKILWENNKYGLITIHNDRKALRSLAIQRDKQSLQQIYRWQFNEIVYAADSTSDIYNSYFAVNLLSRTEQYQMRSRVRLNRFFTIPRDLNYVSLAYAADYRRLFLAGNSLYFEIMNCNQGYGYYWQHNQVVSYHIATDKQDHIRAPLIFKYQYENRFSIFDQYYQDSYNATFPTTPIDYFKYCPTDFILGVTPENIIKIYTRDYKFTRLSQIDQFQKQQLKITQIQCDKGYIFVSASDNKLYTFQLNPTQDSTDWELIIILSAVGLLLMIIIGLVIVKIILKKKKNKLDQKDQISKTFNLIQPTYLE